jgi:diguanylate cyclase (GGDEF)-like protein/PAS domain S-box-containing protein
MLTPKPTWQSDARLVHQLTWLAAGFALLVVLVAPAGYFWLSREAELKEAGVAARLHAAFVTQVVSVVAVGADWVPDVAGLIETDLSPSELPEARTLTDLHGRVVGTVGPPLDTPVLHRMALVAGREGPVAQVHVHRSLRPLVLRTALVALGALGFGLALFGTLRVLPLRALRRTLAALHREEGRAREEVEQRLRIVFEHSIEGIVTFLPDGRLLSCNPAACQLLGAAPEELIGRPLADWVPPAPEASVQQPFDVGQRETQVQRPDGRGAPVELTVSEVRLTGALQYMATLSDITERHAAQDRLRTLANFDSLTGLPNRVLFRERLGQAMARAQAGAGVMALMFLDLDRFKVVNDSLGHAVGDALLRHVAGVLTQSLRRDDAVARVAWDAVPAATVSRLGGDEFTVIAEGLSGQEDAVRIAQRILAAMGEPFLVGREEIYPSTSIGISLYPHGDSGETDLDGLLRHTDMAMYRSKALGRGTYNFYSDDLSAEVRARLSLEARLRHALERGEFVLHYQPKADLRTGGVTGVEALLRWQPSDGAMVAPDQFIGALEDTGLIVPVGAWVIRTACAQVVAWTREGLPQMDLAVNLSARQFRQPDLTDVIREALQQAGLPAQCLEVELTESMVMEDSEASLSTLASLGAMGVRVAIDDFGTGHSSLSYLKRFSVDTLKIDRSFVQDTPDDAEDSAIARAVVALGHSLQLRVVAEGVETEAQADFLRTLGCDEMQGYLLGRPLPAERLRQWWLDRHVLPMPQPLA